MAQKRFGFYEGRGRREERRESAERSEKRETSTIKMRGSKDTMVRSQNKGRSLGEKREERREKREERDKHDYEAQGRVDWKQNGWPDAKFEVRSAKCEMGPNRVGA